MSRSGTASASAWAHDYLTCDRHRAADQWIAIGGTGTNCPRTDRDWQLLAEALCPDASPDASRLLVRGLLRIHGMACPCGGAQ